MYYRIKITLDEKLAKNHYNGEDYPNDRIHDEFCRISKDVRVSEQTLTYIELRVHFEEEMTEEYLYQAVLINCHMRPLILWKHQEVVKSKDKQLFGEEFFNDLVNLNKADILAH